MTTTAHCPSALTMLRRHHLTVGSWIVLIAWLTSSAAAFWYFELSDWRPFAPAGAPSFTSDDSFITGPTAIPRGAAVPVRWWMGRWTAHCPVLKK
jgi:hypothetical protein